MPKDTRELHPCGTEVNDLSKGKFIVEGRRSRTPRGQRILTIGSCRERQNRRTSSWCARYASPRPNLTITHCYCSLQVLGRPALCATPLLKKRSQLLHFRSGRIKIRLYLPWVDKPLAPRGQTVFTTTLRVDKSRSKWPLESVVTIQAPPFHLKGFWNAFQLLKR